MIQTVTDKFYIHDTKIFFRNNTEKDFEDDWLKHKFRHYGYFYQILNMLAADGFDVQADPDVDKIIRKDHYITNWNLKLKNIQTDLKLDSFKMWCMRIQTAADTILINYQKCRI